MRRGTTLKLMLEVMVILAAFWLVDLPPQQAMTVWWQTTRLFTWHGMNLVRAVIALAAIEVAFHGRKKRDWFRVLLGAGLLVFEVSNALITSAAEYPPLTPERLTGNLLFLACMIGELRRDRKDEHDPNRPA